MVLMTVMHQEHRHKVREVSLSSYVQLLLSAWLLTRMMGYLQIRTYAHLERAARFGRLFSRCATSHT